MQNAINTLNKLKSLAGVYTDTAFAEWLNVPQPTLASWKRRDSLDYALIIAKCTELGINLNWLYCGTGEPWNEKTLSPLLPADGMLDIAYYETPSANAGFGVEIDDLPVTFIKLPRGFVRKQGDYFAARVSGSSMARVIADGSIVLCRRFQGDVRNGHIVVATLGGVTYCKRYADGPPPALESDPLTGDYPPLPLAGDYAIHGIVTHALKMFP